MNSQKKTSLSQLKKNFWALSRVRQEAFLENLYKASPQNKDIFSVWLEKNGVSKALENLTLAIEKETTNRIGKFRKIRISKINEILRNAKKYPLPALEIIPLYHTAWRGLLVFIMQTSWLPDRYEVSCSKYLEEYLHRLQDIADPTERRKKKDEARDFLRKIINSGVYLPSVRGVYEGYFK